MVVVLESVVRLTVSAALPLFNVVTVEPLVLVMVKVLPPEPSEITSVFTAL